MTCLLPLQTYTIKGRSGLPGVKEGTTNLTLVELSGKVVHKGFLFAFMSSGSSPFPWSNPSAEFTCDYEKEPHKPEKESQDACSPFSNKPTSLSLVVTPWGSVALTLR